MEEIFYCPFRDDRCCKNDCALFYEDNDTCSIYEVARSITNIEDNYVTQLLSLSKPKMEGK